VSKTGGLLVGQLDLEVFGSQSRLERGEVFCKGTSVAVRNGKIQTHAERTRRFGKGKQRLCCLPSFQRMQASLCRSEAWAWAWITMVWLAGTDTGHRTPDNETPRHRDTETLHSPLRFARNVLAEMRLRTRFLSLAERAR
jgi:hypothetical protein